MNLDKNNVMCFCANQALPSLGDSLIDAEEAEASGLRTPSAQWLAAAGTAQICHPLSGLGRDGGGLPGGILCQETPPETFLILFCSWRFEKRLTDTSEVQRAH